jgi:predicted enzyme related to lactoylglutathione lyase
MGATLAAATNRRAKTPPSSVRSGETSRGSSPRARPSLPLVLVAPARPALIEFPADDPQRARSFWTALLGTELEARSPGEGEGWQTPSGVPAVGVHLRGLGPGDSFSLPYFAVSDIEAALEKVRALGGTVVHPGEKWAICKDSEGSPFGLAQEVQGQH